MIREKFKKISDRHLAIGIVILMIVYRVAYGDIRIGVFNIRLSYLIAVFVALKFLYRFRSGISYGLAIGFLGLSVILLLAKDEFHANLSAATAYTFITIGFLWHVVETLRERKSKVLTENEKVAHIKKQEHIRTPKRDLLVTMVIVIILIVGFAQKVVTRPYSEPGSLQTNAKLVNKTFDSTSRQKTKGLRIKILNGANISGEATRIAKSLKRKKLGDIQATNAKHKTYASTELKYQPEDMERAVDLVNHISDDYFVTTTYLLDKESPFDIILVLGHDKKSLIKSYEVVVLNGNGHNDEALKMAKLLESRGFSNTKVAITNFVDQTHIKYNPANKMISIVVRDVVRKRYQPIMEPTPSLSKKIITVVLGVK